MKFNKDDIYGLGGSVAFHVVILLILWFSVLKTIIPDEDGGVLVNFGNIDAAAGMFEPKYTGQELPQETTTPPPPVPEPKVEAPKEELVTQDLEESVAIQEAKKKKQEEDKRKKEEREKKRKEEAEKERIRKEEAEKKRLADEQRKKEQAISNKVAEAFSGKGNSDGKNQGNSSSGSGNQGSPFGNSDHGANNGVGYGFSLAGRTYNGTGDFPRPNYNAQDEGKIVIDITVNPNGKVIYAEIGKGTNIDNISLRNEAIKTAKRVIFNSIKSVNNQTGTITYNYRFKQ